MINERVGNSKEVSRSTKRHTILLGGLKLLRAISAIGTVLVAARFFGASGERDAWVIAMASATTVITLFFGPINDIFRAKYIHLSESEGEQVASNRLSSLMGFFLFISLLIVAIVLIFPGLLSAVLAPGFEMKQQLELHKMLRILFPTLILTQLTTMWSALLNLKGSFFIPDILAIISSFIQIILVYFLSPYIGIYSLIASFYLSLLLLAIVLIMVLYRRESAFVKIGVPSFKKIRPFLFFSFPFYVSYLMGVINTSLEKALSSILGQGNVSALDYARKFIEVPSSVIIVVTATLLPGVLAKLYSQRKFKEFNHQATDFLRTIVFPLIPCIVILVVCTEDICVLFFGDNLPVNIQYAISDTLRFLSFGLLGILLHVVGGQALIAQNKNVICTIGSMFVILATVTNYLFYKEMGIRVFGLSWSVIHIVSGLFYMYNLKDFSFSRFFLSVVQFLGILGVTIVLSAYMRFIFKNIIPSIHTAKGASINIIGVAVFSLVVLSVFIMIFNMEERRYLKMLLEKIKK